jgi:DNA-binding NarL/FixJ family response regulator
LRILLVDDHALFRHGLRMVLAEMLPQAELYEAESCEGLARFEGLSFDVVLLDLNLPGIKGAQALEWTKGRFPASKVLVVSGEEQPGLIRVALEMGAAGFLPKTANSEVMMAALRIVLEGEVYVPVQAMSGVTGGAAADGIDRLTERQREVLRMALKGVPNKLIGRDLGLSEGTVKSHLSAAFRAMDVRNRTEALYAIAKSGLRI